MKTTVPVLVVGVLAGVGMIVGGAFTANMILTGAGVALIFFLCGVSITRRRAPSVTYL